MKFLRARLASITVARNSKRLAPPRQAFHGLKVRTDGAGDMRGRDTKIQASPNRCRLYATLSRTSEHLYCFRALGSISSGPANQIRLPALETVRCLDP